MISTVNMKSMISMISIVCMISMFTHTYINTVWDLGLGTNVNQFCPFSSHGTGMPTDPNDSCKTSLSTFSSTNMVSSVVNQTFLASIKRKSEILTTVHDNILIINMSCIRKLKTTHFICIDKLIAFPYMFEKNSRVHHLNLVAVV